MRYAVLVFGDYVGTAIGGATIEDEILMKMLTLRDDGPYGLVKKLLLVEARGYYSDFHEVVQRLAGVKRSARCFVGSGDGLASGPQWRPCRKPVREGIKVAGIRR